MDALELVYKGVWGAIILGIAVGISALAWITIRFNLKRRNVTQSLAQATPAQIERVLNLVESIGTEPAVGGILVRTNESASAGTVISIPSSLADFPWSGWSISIGFHPELAFALSEQKADETRLCGRRYMFLHIPRKKTKSGKLRNIFDPSRYLRLRPDLAEALADICPNHPQETLSAILCNGRVEFEPVDQPRIGASAEWMQSPEWQTCDTCKKRLMLVLQLPGTCVSEKRFREATIYLFGCPVHPKDTKQVVQFS
jgi:hypothetical protein